MQSNIEYLVERWEDQRTVKNLMGKYVNCLLLNRQGEIFDAFFSSREDVCLTFNDGSYIGFAPKNHLQDAKSIARSNGMSDALITDAQLRRLREGLTINGEPRA